jgi:hypothetical protein
MGTLMIADIALALSILNLLIWVVVAVGIKKLFKQLYPVFQSFGILGKQNLQYSTVYDRIEEPSEITRPE